MNLPNPELEWQSLELREQIIARLRQLNGDIQYHVPHKGLLHPFLEYDILKDHILLEELEVAIQDYPIRHQKAIEAGISLAEQPENAIRWVALGDSQLHISHKEIK